VSISRTRQASSSASSRRLAHFHDESYAWRCRGLQGSAGVFIARRRHGGGSVPCACAVKESADEGLSPAVDLFGCSPKITGTVFGDLTGWRPQAASAADSLVAMLSARLTSSDAA
jgi:hypothetical protein